MTVAEKKKLSDFDRAAEEAGVSLSGDLRVPFLDLRVKSGAWVTGVLTGQKEIKFKPKKGKNKGKMQTSTLYQIEVAATNILGVEAGEIRAISCDGGLLGWQLNEGKPAGVNYPYPVAIRYNGKDDEGRHQTEVRYPKA